MKKVLFIDEEKWYIDFIISHFEIKYPDVPYEYAKIGIKALEKFEKEKFTCIILDIMMPFGTLEVDDVFAGLIVLEKIRLKDINVPIIIYTARNEENILTTVNRYRNTIVVSKSESSDLLWNELNKYM